MSKALVGHGNFGKFLKDEFEMNERTAQRFMLVAESFKTDNLSDLTAIKPSVLYRLAGATEGAREEALQGSESWIGPSYRRRLKNSWQFCLTKRA